MNKKIGYTLIAIALGIFIFYSPGPKEEQGERPRVRINNGPQVATLPEIPTLDRDGKSLMIYKEKFNGEILKDKKLKERLDLLFIRELYASVVYRGPSEDDYLSWFNALKQGATREGVYRGIILDQEYGQLEQIDGFRDDELVSFTKKILSKYAKINPSDESLKRLNLFSIKRIAVDKLLDVVDDFVLTKGNLYDWYGIMSRELAIEFQDIYQNDLRKNTSAETHKSWAIKVPLQHLKSELIIKLHKAFNSTVPQKRDLSRPIGT